jgi:hypothetical protein
VTRAIVKPERKRSREIFERAEKVLVGGVNSPVRAFRSVGGEPLIIERGNGQYLYDADGNELLDYVGSWGAMLLGHAFPTVSAAIADQAQRGTSFGVTTELEVDLATLIQKAAPFLEKIRFVSSGTEGTMSAVRLARGFTKRNYIVKFEGCYHGHADSFLSQAGSGLATLGIAECPGVPEALAALTLNVPYNDLNAVEKVFAQHPGKIAAIIVEPIAANMGVVLPGNGFLAGLREISQKKRRAADHGRSNHWLPAAQRHCPTEVRRSRRFDDVGQDYRWRSAGCCIRRPRGVDEQRCAAWTGLSGRNACWESAGDAGRDRDSEGAEQARTVRRDSRTGKQVGGRLEKSGVLRGPRCAGKQHRFTVHIVFCARAGNELRGGKALGHQAVRAVLPGDVGPRDFSGTVAVRGRIRIGCAYEG